MNVLTALPHQYDSSAPGGQPSQLPAMPQQAPAHMSGPQGKHLIETRLSQETHAAACISEIALCMASALPCSYVSMQSDQSAVALVAPIFCISAPYQHIRREASQGHAAVAAAWKENVQPPKKAHTAPDSNGHSKAAGTEPRTLAEVAETTLVRDVLCACQVSFLL